MTTPASVTDGRSARSQRTREAVVDALLALLREGDPRPTARQIAERAGISLRSVYVHFDDLEDLFLAAAQREMAVLTSMLREIPREGALSVRVAALCEQRGRIYEEVGPIRRAAALQEPFSPTLSRLLSFTRQAARDELERVFSAELEQLTGPAKTRRLAALDAVSNVEGWETLRRHHGLPYDAARAAMEEAIIAIVRADPA